MKVQLCISAKDLPESAASFAAVSLDGEELGRTEVVTDSSSPDWEKVFVFDLDNPEEKAFEIGLFSESDGSEIGKVEFGLSSLLERKVDGKAMDGGGHIFAFASEHEVSGSLKIQICAKGLKNTEGFLGLSRDKSDPFFKIKGTTSDDVYESDIIQNTLDPVWPETEVQLKDLCDGDLNGPLKFTVYDHDPDGSHDFMGTFQRSVNDLLSTAESCDAIDVNKNGKEAGNVLILVAELVDYVNPRAVGTAAIDAAAAAMKSKADSEAKAAAAAKALEKAEEARVEAEEKESKLQALAEQLADAEKAAEDAEAAAQEAADKAASQSVSGTLNFKLRGEKLKNTEGFFRKPDPFFTLQKPSEAGSEWVNVHISDVIKDTLNPSWQEVEVALCALGDGDLDATLRIVIFDQESDGKHELMGFFESTINGLLSACKSNQSLSMMKGGDETGKIFVADANLTGFVDPNKTKKKLKELADKAEEARFFVMGRKAAAKVASKTAAKATEEAEELAKEAEAAAEEAAVAKAAAEEAANKLAAVA